MTRTSSKSSVSYDYGCIYKLSTEKDLLQVLKNESTDIKEIMFRVEVLNISKRNIYEVEDFKLVRLRLNFTFFKPYPWGLSTIILPYLVRTLVEIQLKYNTQNFLFYQNGQDSGTT